MNPPRSSPLRGAPRPRALVLLGHGSHLNAASSAPVYENALRIRERGLFDEVVEGFWKEEPALPDVLDLVESEEVYVVPLFLAEGYFTGRVLPRELGLSNGRASLADRRIHYCQPVGTHPAMGRFILARALDALRAANGRPDRSALVVIGHGTPRSATSGDSVYRLVNALRAEGAFATVECGFLDQDPRIDEVVASIDAERIVLVPFFVAEGWHTAETVPQELGIDGGISTRAGQTIHYTPPVGTLPEIAEVIVEIARDAGALERGASGSAGAVDDYGATGPDGAGGNRPDRFGAPREIALARRAFFRWVDEGGASGREFLELVIRQSGAEAYELRHRDDIGRAVSTLHREMDARAALRIARLDANGIYRPLRTARSLAGGWVMPALSADELWTAVSLFYPAAVLYWYRWMNGSLSIVPFSASARRQSGVYECLREASPEQVDGAVESCCASCMRTRLWGFDDERLPSHLPQAGRGAIVPCTEPCTLLRTAVRQSLELANAAS